MNVSNLNKKTVSSRVEFLTFIKDRVGDIVPLDEKTVKANTALYRNSDEDSRRIYYRRLGFVMTHMAPLLNALVASESFRRVFVTNVVAEMKFDEMSASDKKKYRNAIKVDNMTKSDPYIVFGEQEFTSKNYEDFIRTIGFSYNMIDVGAFEAAISELSDDDRKTLSFVFSNYFYVLRMFRYNEQFVALLAKNMPSVDLLPYAS